MDDIQTFKKSVKTTQCFNKKDYGLSVGLEALIKDVEVQGKKMTFSIPIEIKFEWDTKGKFVVNYKYPFKGTGNSISDWWKNRKAKKAGYNILLDEDAKLVAEKTKVMDVIKSKLKEIVKAAGKGLVKWVAKKAFKAVVAVVVPFIAPFVLVYDIFSFISTVEFFL